MNTQQMVIEIEETDYEGNHYGLFYFTVWTMIVIMVSVTIFGMIITQL